MGDEGGALHGPAGINATNNNEMYSFHPGGANVVFADGRVAFLKSDIDFAVLAALVTAAGGEQVWE